FDHLRSEGFTRVQVDGELRRLEEGIDLDKKYKHDISVVVDRLVMRPDLRKRLADSIETAVTLAEGMIDIQDAETGEVTTYSERFACLNCGTSMPELEPRMFSFNSPHGACPRCTGLGSPMEIDPDLVVPDPSLAVRIGGLGIHEVTRMSVGRAIEWFENLELTDTERQIGRLVLREINERLHFLDNVGIGYLSLDRAAATLSGGEAQRIRLATQ